LNTSWSLVGEVGVQLAQLRPHLIQVRVVVGREVL
jgi:hypothetical protein